MKRSLNFKVVILWFILLGGISVRCDDWPQWLGPQRDGVWRESGIIEKFPAQTPVPKWRTQIGAGYSGPSVSGGKVYLTDRLLAGGASNPSDPFSPTLTKGVERVLCLNEADGKVLWKHEYECPYNISYPRSEEHTSELQSLRHLVCRLLLEKK